MARKGSISPQVLGAVLVGVFLLGLFLIEPFTRARQFEFAFKKPQTQVVAVSIDEKMKVISPGPLPQSWVGRKVSLEEIFAQALPQTKSVLVNLWATWCQPCLEEIPSLDYLGRQLEQAKNPELPLLITVSGDERSEAIQKLFKSMEKPPQFLVLLDSDGLFIRSCGTERFPETFWINRQGKVLQKWIGPQNWFAADILSTLAQKP